jgi:uncharacterized membrane protein
LSSQPEPAYDDSGQIGVLIVTFVMIGALMAWVAIDASIVFLARQRLASATDAAALTAAQQLSTAAYFEGACVESFPLSGTDVDAALDRYRTGGIQLAAQTQVVSGGPGVAVEGVLVVDLPSIPAVTLDSWTVRYVARARSGITGTACA